MPSPQTAREGVEWKSPPRKRRRWWKILLGIVVALLLIVILIPYLLPMGWIKDKAVKEIEANLHRKAEIKDISFGWFKGISLEGLTIWDAREPAKPFVKLEQLQLRVGWLSLLSGTPEIKKIVLVKPEVFVRKYRDGTYNFSDITAPRPETGSASHKLLLAALPEPATIATDAAPLEAGNVPSLPLILNTGTIKGATLHYEDAVSPRPFVIQKLNLDWNLLPADPKSAALSVTWQLFSGNNPAGEVKITGNLLNIFSTNRAVEKINGNLKVRLSEVLTAELIKSLGLGLAGLSTTPLSADLTMEVTTDDKIKLTGEMAIDKTTYLLIPNSPVTINGIKLTEELILNTSVLDKEPFNGFGKLTSKVNVTIKEIKYADNTLNDFVFPVQLTNKVAEINGLTGKLNGGDLSFSAKVDLNQADPDSAVNFKVNKANLSQTITTGILSFLQPVLGNLKLAQAQMNFSSEVKLTARGMEWPKIKDTMKGTGTLVLEGGTIEGFDVLKKLGDKVGDEQLAHLEFDRIEQDFRIENGRVYNPSTVIGGQGRSMHLTGWTDFSGNIDQTITFQGDNWGKNMAQAITFINKSGGVRMKGTIPNPVFTLPEFKLQDLFPEKPTLPEIPKKKKKND